jgi:hypothetical protein
MEQVYNLFVLSKYGPLAASARQRFLQYRSFLDSANVAMTVSPLFGDDYLSAIMQNGAKPLRMAAVAYIDRLLAARRVNRADGVLVHCELLPFVPSFLEAVMFRFRVPLIFDYDDAIFHQYDQHKSSLVRTLLGGKLKPLLRRAELAICGNAYLQAYAAEHCRQTEIVPTVVDTDVYGSTQESRGDGPVTVGWIGSPSTWTFVKPLVPLLAETAERHNLAVRIVGAGSQSEHPPRFEFLPWSEAGEVGLIQGMDIGIMPLPNEPWARGKCGYKLIQYMACGLPVVASPVGVNSDIVDHGQSGFLASTPQEWADALALLAGDPAMRRAMGTAGRRKIERAYSLAVHGPRLAAMLREVMEAGRQRRAAGNGR